MEEGKVYVITDPDTAPLFRLAGASVIEVNSPDETKERLVELLKSPDAAVVLVSNDVAVGIEEEVREISSKVSKPVVTLIPGRKQKPPKLDPNEVLLKALGFG
ncbi:V-type ATP synthase subunit F [Ignicoccus hospitalis]|uniref:Vacuolar H+-transporting two-sector ATPase, F subunit n=1 Tax=Ignicoccus hospitalis (strain KIN4/I / DSM 18386 / JCM 14125) TaxID=453591 RepID=A8ABF6_IGNH4|nr:V-type ATP synthase subunit F [Ignicoccus hospitalis]ABU82258.1 Vacuolar H+-transporting two-sector ATPase, F subunit [Ignicoccus hospitalis KIN4/I]HIH90823.1 hypothetical protein [Desulfurococcaceae archaeon]